MQLKIEGEVLIVVPKKRKCHSSLDYDKEKDIWIMSFGDDEAGWDQDVQVEFSMSQFKQHRKMINEIWDEMSDKAIGEDHFGEC